MAFLIDSSVFIELERLQRPLATLEERTRKEPVYITSITASELLHGVHRADTAVRRGIRESFVEMTLQRLPILPFDLDVARVHARVWADLRRRGVSIGAHDTIIAATALHLDLTVLTHNERHFGRVPDLRLLVW